MPGARATAICERTGACDPIIRELTRLDRAAVQLTFRRLSERSRVQRYLSPKQALNQRDLEYLATLDHWHHEAFIAWSTVPRAPIGIARYVRQADFATAEIAVEVVDPWQGRGVGAGLARVLRERAMRAGIRRFVAIVNPENAGAHALAARLGRLHGGVTQAGSRELIVELDDSGDHRVHVRRER